MRALLGHLPDPELETSAPKPDDRFDTGGLEGRQLGGVLLTELIGVGGHGAVYRGEQGRPRRAVAVKVIDLPPATFSRAREEVLRRFEREAAIIARIEHPGIARIIAAGIDVTAGRPVPYLITDFVDDPLDLETWWTRHASPHDRIDVLRQIAETVQAAHERAVLHLDLKPENILVDPEDRVRIIDFGIATVVNDTAQEELLGGSVGFASPEQLDPDRDATVRSDTYAIGRILQHLRRIDPTPVRGVVGRDLDAIATRAASLDPDLRYPTARSLADDLEAIASGMPPKASSASRARFIIATIRRSPLATSLVTFFVGIGIVLLVLLLQSRQDLVRAQRSLEEENARLAKAIDEESEARYRFKLAAIGSMDQDPLLARRAIRNIDPSREDFTIRYFRTRLNQALRGFVDKGINAYRIRGTPDGRHTISGAARGVYLFRGRSVDPVLHWEGLGPQIYGVAISDDGTRGVAGTDDGSVYILDLTGTDPAEAGRVEDYTGGVVLGVEMHPSGDVATIIGGDGELHWIDLTTTPPTVKTIPLGVDTRWCTIDISPDGERLVAAGYDGRFAIIELPADGGAPTPADIRWGDATEQRIRTIRWSPDATRLAMVAGDRVSIADAEGRPMASNRLQTNSLWGLAWSPDGERLAIGGWDQMLRILDAKTLEPLHHRFGADGPIWSLDWSRPRIIASGEENAALRHWRDRAPTDVTRPLPAAPVQAAFGSNIRLVVAGEDGSLSRAANRTTPFDVLIPGMDRSRCQGAVDESGFYRVVEDRIERFDLNGTPLDSLALDRSGADTALWRDASRDRFVVRVDQDILMIDGATGRTLVETKADGQIVRGAGFDDEGRFHLACGFDTNWKGLLRLDPTTGEASSVKEVSQSNLRSAHRIEGGWLTASATNDAFVYTPDDDTTESIEVDFAHAGGVNVFRTIDDGATLVTGGTDGLVRFWSLPEFHPMLRVSGPTKASVRTIDVVSDNRILVGRADNSLQIIEAARPAEASTSKVSPAP